MLLFEGKPFSLTTAEVDKYSRETIYRVGKQYITPDKDPQSNQDHWIGSVGVPCSYEIKHKIKDENGKDTFRSGKLIYCDSHYEDETKRMVFSPPNILIERPGYMTVPAHEYEKNYFLQNHPLNEEVNGNEKHPNRRPTMDTVFSTFVAERAIERNMDVHEAKLKIATLILERDEKQHYVMDSYTMKGIASTLLEEGMVNGWNVAELGLFDRMEEKVLRERLLSVCDRYPKQALEAMSLAKTDFVKEIEKFKDAGVLSLIGDEWYHIKGNKSKEAIMKVPSGRDAVQCLVLFFSDTDLNSVKFKMIKAAYGKYEDRLKLKEEIAQQ